MARPSQSPLSRILTRAERLSAMSNLIWLIVAVLVILWLVGFLAVEIGGNLIHILIVIAVALVIWRLATGKKVL